MVVKKIGTAKFPAKYGNFELTGFEGTDGEQFLVLTKGKASGDDVLVRLHSACVTGDVFHSKRCDCGDQLQESINLIAEEGRGVVIYLYSQEGRGIGALNKVKAYCLQDNGRDTVEANLELGFGDDERDYKDAAEILRKLGVTSVRLLTNNPRKISGLEENGIKVKRVPIEIPPEVTNESYLRTKKKKLGHLLSI